MIKCYLKLKPTLVNNLRRCYTVQRFVQLDSQRFWPLQGMLHRAMYFVQLVSQRIARQVARNIAQCNSAFMLLFSDIDLRFSENRKQFIKLASVLITVT